VYLTTTDDLQKIYKVWSLENVCVLSVSKTTSKVLKPDTFTPCNNPDCAIKGVYIKI